MNYKSKDSTKDLDDCLQENYWIEELDKSIVQLVFNSVNDKESFVEICKEMLINQKLEQNQEAQINTRDEERNELNLLLDKLVNASKISIDDKNSFLKSIGNNISISELKEFPDDVLSEIVSNSIENVASQIHLLARIRDTQSYIEVGKKTTRKKLGPQYRSNDNDKIQDQLQQAQYRQKQEQLNTSHQDHIEYQDNIQYQVKKIEPMQGELISIHANLDFLDEEEQLKLLQYQLQLLNQQHSSQHNLVEEREQEQEKEKRKENNISHDEAYLFFEELFPNFDERLIRSLLYENEDDVQKVLDILISIQDSLGESECIEEPFTENKELENTDEPLIDNFETDVARIKSVDIVNIDDVNMEIIDKLSLLSDMFPTYDRDRLKVVLENNEDSIENTISALLSNTENNDTINDTNVIEINLVNPNKELTDNSQNENKKNVNNRQPQQKLPTRYDQKQKHIYQNKQNKKERNTPKQDKTQPPKSPQHWTLANKIQFNNLLLNFKTLDRDILESIFMQYDLNMEVTTNAINDLLNSNKPLPKIMSNTTHQPKATYWNPDANVNNINEQDSKQKGSAKIRNDCYHQAARAFINSEHDKWRLYSDLGKRFDPNINPDQLLLTQKIVSNLDTKNKFIRQEDRPKIDLHGFYVKNAILMLSKLLNFYKGKCPIGVIVITGVGHHSTGPVKLRPAVYNYLLENGFKFKVDSPGSFLVFP